MEPADMRTVADILVGEPYSTDQIHGRAILPGRARGLDNLWRGAAFLCALAILSIGPFACADQNDSQQVFFENSLSPESYFYSTGTVSAPSTLKLVDGKLPVESSEYISGPKRAPLVCASPPSPQP